MDNLDYIKSMGFDAIWISPVPENTERGYHGYWAKNLTSINPHFGTAEELKQLIKACHDRNVTSLYFSCFYQIYILLYEFTDLF